MADKKIIIGGGAAGMMAAITAARSGKKVVLIERNEKMGRKIGITGKGRCNVTNDCDAEDFFLNVAKNPKFLYSAFYTFTNEDTKNFFENLGVKLKVERGKRVFPESDRAGDIVMALVKEVRRLGVSVVEDRAKEILTDNGKAIGVKCENGDYFGESILIATGGASYRRTGSTGDGYVMAEKAGHTIVPLRPCLIPIVSEGTEELSGLSLKNVSLTVLDGKGKTRYTDFGEMLFTHFGISGPIVLSASGHMRKEDNYTLLLDLKPALDDKTLDARLLRDFEKYKNRDLINSLSDLLPQRLITHVIARAEIDERKKINSITREERERLISAIKRFEIKPLGFRPIEEAIVTGGGVDVREIDPSTMESRLVKNLFFAGEVIYVDAYTGGFNLQIAFSTGHLAGMNM